MDSDLTKQPLMKCSAFINYSRKIEVQWQIQGIFKESGQAYDLIRREVQGTCTHEHRCVKPFSYFQYGLTLVGW